MNAERRADGEVRVSGRTLAGVAMPYGTISPDFRERFEPGAFGGVPATMAINLQHDSGIVLVPAASLSDSPRALSVRAELGEGSGVAALVRRGALGGFSVEFRVRAERRDAAGVRVVERAELTGLALVDRPAYPAAGAEVRARSGWTLRTEMPLNRELQCECDGPVRVFELTTGINAAFDEAFREGTNRIVAAYLDSYSTPLASTSRGTLRGAILGVGPEGRRPVVEIDIPDSEAGRALLAAWEDSGIIVRPFLRDIRSENVRAGVRRITGGTLRALIVTATDARGGWTEPEIVPTPPRLPPAPAPALPPRTPAPDVVRPVGQVVDKGLPVVPTPAPVPVPEAALVALAVLSPWPTEAAALAAAVACLKAAIANDGEADDTIARVGAAAAALVEREAPGAPQAVRNEAMIRMAGYLYGSDFGGIRKESIGPRDVEYVANHAPAFRNSGAAMLLTPWKVRRAGAIA